MSWLHCSKEHVTELKNLYYKFSGVATDSRTGLIHL
jgi:hypothetical protein